MKTYQKAIIVFIITTFLFIGVNCAAPMTFNSAFNHMYVWNSDDPNLESGWGPDTPELQNVCSFFQGYFAAFKIDYSQFGQAGYNPGGDDLKYCVKNDTEVPESHRKVYITDYLNIVTGWPALYYYGPLTPNVPHTDLYSMPNGFNAEFKMDGSDPNTWCISNSRFSEMLAGFSGQDIYKFSLSVNLRSFDDCKEDWNDQFTVRMKDNSHSLIFTPGATSSKKKSRACCYFVIFLILLGGGGFGVYWFKFRDSGGFK